MTDEPEQVELDPARVDAWKVLRRHPEKGGYGGYRRCASCGQMAECAGERYDGQVCLRCYATPAKRRPRSTTRRPATTTTGLGHDASVKAAVVADLRAGMSQADARAKHNVARATVWSWAKEAGLTRTRQENA